MPACLPDYEIEYLVLAIEARELFAVMGAIECERIAMEVCNDDSN